MTLYKGMTVNERLFLSGRMDEFDALVRAKDVNGLKTLLKDVEITDESSMHAIIESLGLEYMPRQKETRLAKRKWIKILLLLAPLCLVVLLGCMHEEDYVGTYKRKHKYVTETIEIYPNHTFLQTYADSNGLDSNTGSWYIRSNLLVLKGRIMYEPPVHFENANFWLGVGEKRTSYVTVSSGCIIVELDFPEFNLCKE
ncbi:MAG: hypothetical protein IKZ45_07730 [Fibrobacter sp.]|nr:hypothetical protein [Fibrobacter sp.]